MSLKINVLSLILKLLIFIDGTEQTPKHYETYDFIIIGAGTSGSVLANRLTENPKWRVLLLEAGIEENFLTDVPLMAPILAGTIYNWGYKTEPGPINVNGSDGYCLSMVEGRCNWPRGKALGGTSVINFMIYSRGTKRDYDEWEAMGNEGWSYRDVLPYFLKSENSRLSYQDKNYHATGGYLDVGNVPYVSKLLKPFLQSAIEMGYDIVDYNGKSALGASPVQVNIRRGRRVSASKAFLKPIRSRKNLKILPSSQVTKILIDPETRQAYGVEFTRGERRFIAKSKKEVLLCAGALNSPQLLMLSGIGPKKHLESHGIRLLADLPVGENLQDHVSMATLTFLVNDSITIIETRTASNLANTFNYLFRGTGPLTLPSGAEALAFINTETNNNTDPDVELVLGIGSLTGDDSGSIRKIFGLNDQFYENVFSQYKGLDAFSIVPILLHPKSRGRVQLKSTDPFEMPVLQANYYDSNEDLETMIKGIRAAIRLGTSPPFKRYNTTLIPILCPGCEHIAYDTDEFWTCVARHVTTTLSHFVGTCKMAPRQNGGVVDPRLRVYGISALRVVDTSIIPKIVTGHTAAPAFMIGEKASDMIKEDWGYKI